MIRWPFFCKSEPAPWHLCTTRSTKSERDYWTYSPSLLISYRHRTLWAARAILRLGTRLFQFDQALFMVCEPDRIGDRIQKPNERMRVALSSLPGIDFLEQSFAHFVHRLHRNWDKIVIEDPAWEPDPDWVVTGGFDHGKTNPTALLRAYIGFDGTIIFAGEYYMPGKEISQHAPAMRRMRDFDRMENVQADPSMFHGTNQQEQRPGHSQERAKSFAELYAQAGVSNLLSFGGDDKSDVSFAARLMLHWADLDKRMPSVRIVCRKGLYQDKPQPGLQHRDCPNLLWELMVARRVKLTAQQLLSRNTSEAIVDKDNHARDAMKYLVMSQPEPSRKSLERRVVERVYTMQEEAKKQGVTDARRQPWPC